MFEPYSSCLFNTENTHIIKILRFCIVVIEAIGMLISAILKCELQNVHIQFNLKAHKVFSQKNRNHTPINVGLDFCVSLVIFCKTPTFLITVQKSKQIKSKWYRIYVSAGCN